MEKPCKVCKKLFKRKYRYSQKQWDNAKYCSRHCLGIGRQQEQLKNPEYREFLKKIATGRKQSEATKRKRGIYKTGIERNNWKGGISTDGAGYLRDNKTKIRIHREVVEKYLGRKLNREEQVHHLDGNKMNNVISNLIILSASNHTKIHWYNRKRSME